MSASILAAACTNATGGDPEASQADAVTQGRTSPRTQVQGRVVGVFAQTGILVEGDEECFLVLEPTVGKFVAFYDGKRARCLHSGPMTERELDLSLRGKIVRATPKTITDPAVRERIEQTKEFFDIPARAEFVEFGGAYTIVGDVDGGAQHEYDCERVADENAPMEEASLTIKVNAEKMSLKAGASSFVGIADSRYRPRAATPTLRRFGFGLAETSNCDYSLRVTIDQSAFEGAATAPLRAECVGGDSPSWARFTCTRRP